MAPQSQASIHPKTQFLQAVDFRELAIGCFVVLRPSINFAMRSALSRGSGTAKGRLLVGRGFGTASARSLPGAALAAVQAVIERARETFVESPKQKRHPWRAILRPPHGADPQDFCPRADSGRSDAMKVLRPLL